MERTKAVVVAVVEGTGEVTAEGAIVGEGAIVVVGTEVDAKGPHGHTRYYLYILYGSIYIEKCYCM
jgi:hypothetical protein